MNINTSFTWASSQNGPEHVAKAQFDPALAGFTVFSSKLERLRPHCGPNYNNLTSEIKVGVKSAKVEGDTIYIYERVSLRESNEPFKVIGKFTPSKIEEKPNRVYYYTKKYYGKKVLDNVKKEYETIPF